jgi:uncharacterized protein YcbK (DUF882 family)
MSNHYTVRFSGVDADPATIRRRVESIPGLSSEHTDALVAAAEGGEQGGSVTLEDVSEDVATAVQKGLSDVGTGLEVQPVAGRGVHNELLGGSPVVPAAVELPDDIATTGSGWLSEVDGELTPTRRADPVRIRAVDDDGRPRENVTVEATVSLSDGSTERHQVTAGSTGYATLDLSHLDADSVETVEIQPIDPAGEGVVGDPITVSPDGDAPATVPVPDRLGAMPELDSFPGIAGGISPEDLWSAPELFTPSIGEDEGACTLDFEANVEVRQNQFNQLVRAETPSQSITNRKEVDGPLSFDLPAVKSMTRTDDVTRRSIDIIQPGEITLGKLNVYEQTWTRVGHGIGKLLHSLSLAPCEETEVAVVDWSREERARREEDTSVRESATQEMHRDRTIEEIVEGTVDEYQRGGSTSVQGGIGIMGSSFSIGGGAAHSRSWSRGHRETTINTVNSLSDAVSQRASSMRSKRSTVVTESRQVESERVKTRSVRNHNQHHAMTVEYFQVLEHYAVETQLQRQHDVLMIPYRVPGVLWTDLPDFEDFEVVERAGNIGAEAGGGGEGDTRTRVMSLRPPADPLEESEFLRWIDEHAEALERAAPDDHQDGFEALHRLVHTPEVYEATQPRITASEWTVDIQQGWRPGLTLLVHADRTVELRPDEAERGRSRLKMHSDPVEVQDIEKVEVIYEPDFENMEAFPIDFEELADISYSLENLDVTAHTDPTKYLRSEQSYRLQVSVPNDGVTLDTENNSKGLTATAPSPDVLEVRTKRYQDYAALERLGEHIKANRMEYLRNVWLTEDADRRALRLDNYVYDFEENGEDAEPVPVLELIENKPVGVVGNMVAFRLLEDGQLATATHVDPTEAIARETVSVPTKGVYAETLLSDCVATEQRDVTRNAPTGGCRTEAPEIEGVTVGSRAQADDVQPSGFPASIVNLQSPPSAPEPSGTAAAQGILGSSDLFRNMSLGTETAQAAQGLANTALEETGKNRRAAIEALTALLTGGASAAAGSGENGQSSSSQSGGSQAASADGQRAAEAVGATAAETAAGAAGGEAAGNVADKAADIVAGEGARSADPGKQVERYQANKYAQEQGLMGEDDTTSATANTAGSTHEDRPRYAQARDDVAIPGEGGAEDEPEEVVFPSGESLPIVDPPDEPVVPHPDEPEQVPEYWDPLASGNPLLDTSGDLRDRQLSAHFTVDEFAESGNPAADGQEFERARIDPAFVRLLENLRAAANEETGQDAGIVIHSGYRSYRYNHEEGGADYSAHCSGYGADIEYRGDMPPLEFAKLALEVGDCDTRVGYKMAGDTIHVDKKPRSQWTDFWQGDEIGMWDYSGTPQNEFEELVCKRIEVDQAMNCQPAATEQEEGQCE